jgi:hypothetical protein
MDTTLSFTSTSLGLEAPDTAAVGLIKHETIQYRKLLRLNLED